MPQIPFIPEMPVEKRWYDCCDIKVTDDDGKVLFDGPKFLRCMYAECNKLVTYGYMDESKGLCFCGGRKFRTPTKLTEEEKADLLDGKYPLNAYEQVYVGNDNI